MEEYRHLNHKFRHEIEGSGCGKNAPELQCTQQVIVIPGYTTTLPPPQKKDTILKSSSTWSNMLLL